MDRKVGIVGSGLVGKSWAMIFASRGYNVCLYDVIEGQVTSGLEYIKKELTEFKCRGALRGDLTVDEQVALISGSNDLEECVKGACYVQECVPEDLGLKLKVWAEIDRLISNDDVILASSTSCILPSKISEKLEHREQFIVAHPVNPPYFVPVVELVPAPWTKESIRAGTRAVMEEIGQKPVSMSKELPGFILNRLQYPVIFESWGLVSNGIVSHQDLDVVMKDGLGQRYAVCGPMEVIHLNADGIYNYVERYGRTIRSIGSQLYDVPKCFKLEDPEDREEVKKVLEEVVKSYPLDRLDERRQRRDAALAKISQLKRELGLF